jgi:hypothetical protein
MFKLFTASLTLLMLAFTVSANEATNDPLPPGDPYVVISGDETEEGNPATSDDEDLGDFKGGGYTEEGNPATSDDEDLGDFKGGGYTEEGTPASGSSSGPLLNTSPSSSGSGGAWQRGKDKTSQLGLPEGTIAQIVFEFASWILLIFGSVAIIGFVIAGILYLTSAGDEDKMKKAKQGMIYAIIGVAVGLLGYVIVQAVDEWLWGFSDTF